MAELAESRGWSGAPLTDIPRHHSPLVRRWLARVIPILSILVLIIVAWYAFAAYMNLQALDAQHLDVNQKAWQSASFVDKIHQSLTDGQPTVPTAAQTFGDLLNRLRQSPANDTSLWNDLLYTGRAAVLGFFLGAIIGIILALGFMSVPLLTRSLMPYVVASQTIPIVALVPPIMVTLGLGLRSEVSISAYLAFFSITISTYKGLMSIEPVAFDLMRSYAANPWQIFIKLRLPAALPFLFTGLKIGITASLVGAIIAELPSGSSHGLGQGLVAASTYSLNIQLWSTMLAAACLGLLLYGVVVLAERLLVRWNAEMPA